MDCGSKAREAGNPYRAIPHSKGAAMSNDGLLPLDEAAHLVLGSGISLALGYHPRANIELALLAASKAVDGGGRAALLDCDRTISLSGISQQASSRILIGHPESVEQILLAVGSIARLPDIQLLVINRAGSLVSSFEIVARFEEKKELWTRLGPALLGLSKSSAVLLLEDARRTESVEYMVHPALFYVCSVILDAAEDGKKVESYRILKKRAERTP